MSRPGAKAGKGITTGKRKPAAKPRKAGVRAAGMDDKVRAYIVTRLACYDSVKDIHASLVEMEIDISAQAISRYNPENVNGPSGKWKDLFDHARTEFLQAMAEEPMANRAFRLRKLHTIFDKHMAGKNYVMAAAVLEQAAKETGNVYTNVAKVQGTVLPGQVAPQDTTPDERRNMLADRLKDIIASRAPKQLTQH